MSDTALDQVLEAYRDMFGVKTERANIIHRLACVEVERLREIARAVTELDIVIEAMEAAAQVAGAGEGR